MTDSAIVRNKDSNNDTCSKIFSNYSYNRDVILVNSGFCNKLPQHIKNRNALLTVLEVGNLRSSCPHGPVRPSLVADFYLDLHMVGGSKAISGFLL